MGEVSEMFDVNPSLIRFWEQKFDILKPDKNKKGNRLFTPTDVENLKLIYHLVKEEGMTLAGAQKRIKQNPEGLKRDMEIVDRLQRLKTLLLEVRQELKGANDEDDVIFVDQSVSSESLEENEFSDPVQLLNTSDNVSEGNEFASTSDWNVGEQIAVAEHELSIDKTVSQQESFDTAGVGNFAFDSTSQIKEGSMSGSNQQEESPESADFLSKIEDHPISDMAMVAQFVSDECRDEKANEDFAPVVQTGFDTDEPEIAVAESENTESVVVQSTSLFESPESTDGQLDPSSNATGNALIQDEVGEVSGEDIPAVPFQVQELWPDQQIESADKLTDKTDEDIYAETVAEVAIAQAGPIVAIEQEVEAGAERVLESEQLIQEPELPMMPQPTTTQTQQTTEKSRPQVFEQTLF
jgi:DNA-binding transcriptional MerR regulator